MKTSHFSLYVFNCAATAYPDDHLVVRMYDIDDQGTFDPEAINQNNNYRYDELGRLISDAQENIESITWRHDDKISSILKANDAGEIEFTYDPSGNRLSKTVIGPQFEAVYIDYYIRDAQGNVLATYRRHFDYQADLSYYTVAERAIYGSDRMGVYAYNDTVYPLPPSWVDDFRPVHTGHKKYELKNHLGNVMAVVHGRKQAVQGTGSTISHYTAIPAFSGDYSAFGVRLRGRGEGEYRYGFQDQEHDTETFRGGSVNYKYRMHRPDLGRFFSVDPLHRDYPWNSGYAFSENRVVDAVELEGLESVKYTYTWNPEYRAYSKPLRQSIFPSIPKSGALHEFVGGPDIEDGFDKRVIYRPGPWAISNPYDKQVKSAATVVSEFKPFISITQKSSIGAGVDLDKGMIGGKAELKVVINKSKVMIDKEGISTSSEMLYNENTVGGSAFRGVFRIEGVSNSMGNTKEKINIMNTFNMERNYDSSGVLENTQFSVEQKLETNPAGGVTNEFIIEGGIKREGPTMKDTNK